MHSITFHVKPVRDRWDIVIDGQGRYVNFLTRDSALAEATRLAGSHRPSRVEITEPDGRVSVAASFLTN